MSAIRQKRTLSFSHENHVRSYRIGVEATSLRQPVASAADFYVLRHSLTIVFLAMAVATFFWGGRRVDFYAFFT